MTPHRAALRHVRGPLTTLFPNVRNLEVATNIGHTAYTGHNWHIERPSGALRACWRSIDLAPNMLKVHRPRSMQAKGPPPGTHRRAAAMRQAGRAAVGLSTAGGVPAPPQGYGNHPPGLS
jgi:hypothetical protein